MRGTRSGFGRWLRILAILAVLGLIAAGCGDDDTASNDDSAATDDGGSPTTAPTATQAPTEPPTAEPVAAGENMLVEPTDDGDTCTADRVGGSATFGLARATSSLDPTVALGSGVAGGIEIAAIFDTLILYDAANGTYLPHVAESVSTDEDLTVWTVKLRPGITFGNGDPLTTEAVKFSFERMKNAKVSSAGLAAAIVDMEIVDDLTIVFTLNGPSASFLYVLAEDAGNITNPNVVNAMTPEEFSLDPNGAGVGPYEVESFVPNEELVLRAKDDYWGGPVCIETLTMTYVPGAAATYDAFTLGELDMAFMRGAPLEVAKLRADAVTLQGAVTNGETVMILNVGREGTNSPVQDVRLRQAIAAAIDVDLIDERINEGAGIPGTALVADSEGWSPGVPGPQYDPTLAESLVAEVKADGWDGKLTLVSNDSPQQAVDTAILVQGLLEAVGMEITVENLPAGEVSTRVITDANFDLAFFGISALEDAPTARYTSYQTGSPRNRTGYGTPEMDAALEELNRALTRADKKAAMATIQEIWNRDVPSIIIGHGEWLIASHDNVHGIFISRDVTPMFFDTYIDS